MKKAASLLSYLFHPLLMPSVGLWLLLNSGTYIALLDPAAKRAIMFVMALGTLLFPLMMMPVLYYRKLMSRAQQSSGEEQLLLHFIILILYIFTTVYFMRLPLNRTIQAYVLSVALTLFTILVVNFRFRICYHSAALGGLAGLIIGLILRFETPLEGMLILVFLAGGVTGSARLLTGTRQPGGVYAGYVIGFVVVLITLLVY